MERPLHTPVASPLGDTETERLVLRRIRQGDDQLLAPVFAKPEVWRYPLGRGLTAEETRKFVDRQAADWSAMGFGLGLGAWIRSRRRIGCA